MKESRLHNKPANEDIAQLKTTELHLNSEIMKLKSDLRILTEISKQSFSLYSNSFQTLVLTKN